MVNFERNNENKENQLNSSGNKLFFKDVVYIMSIILLSAALLLLALLLPETIKKNSNQSQIDELSQYINNLQKILDSTLSQEENPLQFPGIKVSLETSNNQGSASLALQDIDADITSVDFYYREKDNNNNILKRSISDMDNFYVKIDIGGGEYIYQFIFSYDIIDESFETIDFYKEEGFFMLCNITFDNGYKYLLCVVGENNTLPEASYIPYTIGDFEG